MLKTGPTRSAGSGQWAATSNDETSNDATHSGPTHNEQRVLHTSLSGAVCRTLCVFQVVRSQLTLTISRS
ncbi:hypothetical protein NCCP2495_19150 [Dietzia sp. NCCP-2495]|nr:hypothetical protein NCCP2495_19150 [Dietzia sp. NCCP-2495]